jgi:glycosyltransferase involved in cell wall biosynthesis
MFNKKLISVIIPFYNEQWNIIPLFEEVKKSLKDNFSGFDYEIIMVDDWSKDNTWEDIKKCKQIDSKVIWRKLNTNYWQSIAMDAWFKKSSWDFVFTLDWDWQNNPNDFKKLYDKLLNDDLDLVAGYRKKRKDPIWMLVVTKSARLLRWILIKDWVKDSGCTLRIYKKVVVENLELWWEMHRFIIALSKINWFKIGEIKVDHRARTIWKSKYNWRKSIKWLIDLVYIWFIAKYQSRPLHLFWFVGIINFFIWSSFILFSIYQKIFIWLALNRSWWLLVWIFLVQIWVILFIFGIVIDLLIRNNYASKWKKRYIVKEKI